MICDRCREGRHVRCTGDCPCQTCEARSRAAAWAPEGPVRPPHPAPSPTAPQSVIEPVTAAQRRRKKTRKPGPFPLPPRPRKYSKEAVMRATALKAAGASWPEVARQLDVNESGIRYAVNFYGLERPEHLPQLPGPAVDPEYIEAARASIQMLEAAIECAKATVVQLQVFVDNASDS